MNGNIPCESTIVNDVNVSINPNRFLSLNLEKINPNDAMRIDLDGITTGMSINGWIGFYILPKFTYVKRPYCRENIGVVPLYTANVSVIFRIYSSGSEIYSCTWKRSEVVPRYSFFDDELNRGTYFVWPLKQTVSLNEEIEDLSFSFQLASVTDNNGKNVLNRKHPIYMDSDISYQVIE